LYDADFCKPYTDSPILIRTDTLQYLDPRDVIKDYKLADLHHGYTYKVQTIKDEYRERLGDFMVWDTAKNQVVPMHRELVGGHMTKAGIDPALEGTFRVKLLDGKEADVMPVFQMYKIHVQDFDLDTTNQITNSPKDLIVRWARDCGTVKPMASHGAWEREQDQVLWVRRRGRVLEPRGPRADREHPEVRAQGLHRQDAHAGADQGLVVHERQSVEQREVPLRHGQERRSERGMHRGAGPGDDVRRELRGRGLRDQLLDGVHVSGHDGDLLEPLGAGVEGRDPAVVRHPQRPGHVRGRGDEVGGNDRRQEVPGPLEIRDGEQGGCVRAADSGRVDHLLRLQREDAAAVGERLVRDGANLPARAVLGPRQRVAADVDAHPAARALLHAARGA